jgi:hypothetical protein
MGSSAKHPYATGVDRGGASEDGLREWLGTFYARCLTNAAAAILASTGTMRGGSRVLHRAGFSVLPGYFTEAEVTELGGDGEAALRRWIGRERKAIFRATRRGDFFRVTGGGA